MLEKVAVLLSKNKLKTEASKRQLLPAVQKNKSPEEKPNKLSPRIEEKMNET